MLFGHFCTWKVWVPRTVISFSIVTCMIEIAVMTPMMEATPSTTPTRVRKLRSLLLPMAPSDIANTSPRLMRVLFIAQRLDRVEPGAAPGRDHAGHDADDDR